MKYKKKYKNLEPEEYDSIIRDRTPTSSHRPMSIIELSSKYKISHQELITMFRVHLSSHKVDLTEHPVLVKLHKRLKVSNHV